MKDYSTELIAILIVLVGAAFIGTLLALTWHENNLQSRCRLAAISSHYTPEQAEKICSE